MADAIPTGQAPSGLSAGFAALGASLSGTAAAFADLVPKMNEAATAAANLDAAKKQLAADTQFLTEQTKAHTQAMKDEAAAAKPLADAFGNLASKFGEVSAQADHATDGLQGVMWSMVHATAPTVTLTDAQNALIESLAKISDAGGASSLWVGHLIAQLKDGTLSFDDFRKQVNSTLQGLSMLGPVMGNTAFELNAINTILSAFKNNAAGGWPGTTTIPIVTAP